MIYSKSKKIIETGKGFIGIPYLFGASTGRTDKFDCSSFVQYVYAQHNIQLPRNSRQQFLCGRAVHIDAIRRGDLLFFTTPKRKKFQAPNNVGHVAIFIGNNKMLHTSRLEGKVSIAPLSSEWRERIVGVRRVIT